MSHPATSTNVSVEEGVIAEATRKIRDALKVKGFLQNEVGIWGFTDPHKNYGFRAAKDYPGVRAWLLYQVQQELAAWNADFQKRKEGDLKEHMPDLAFAARAAVYGNRVETFLVHAIIKNLQVLHGENSMPRKDDEDWKYLTAGALTAQPRAATPTPSP